MWSHRMQGLLACRGALPRSTLGLSRLALPSSSLLLLTPLHSAVRWCSSSTATTPPPPPPSANTATSTAPAGTTPTTNKATTTRKIQIAVVGSGPSGCFMASYLTKKDPRVHIDVFERLPVPFGFCRYGVAPDHPEVKRTEDQFLKLFKEGRVTWVGNVTVGKEIPLEAMLQHYAAVIFATGAEESRRLDIPGSSSLGGILPAADFVKYYNTMPFPYGSPRFCPFDLDRVSRVAVIGNGNVALDVARVLGSAYTYFAPTDMNCVAVKELMKNRVRAIDIVARRGVSASAFTIAEFRELTRIDAGRVSVAVDDFDLDRAIQEQQQQQDTNTNASAAPSMQAQRSARAHKRLMELVHTFCVPQAVMRAERRDMAANEKGESIAGQPSADNNNNSSSKDNEAAASKATEVMNAPKPGLHERGPCNIRFRYHLKPIRFLPHPQRKNYVGAILFERTNMPAKGGSSEKQDKGEHMSRYCVLPCDLVLTSIGYQASPLPNMPYDNARGALAHDGHGRVASLPRVYCTGWAKNGSHGVIANAVRDAQVVGEAVLQDMAAHVVPTTPSDPSAPEVTNTDTQKRTTTMYGKYGLLDYLLAKKMEIVSVAGLERIFYVEKERGVDLGKRLEKMDNVRDMLDVALGGELGKQTSERVRGIMPARPEAMDMLKKLLDDETDLSSFAHTVAREMPGRMSQENFTGPIDPAQL